MDWKPGKDAAHPLARFGQELQVSIVVASSVSTETWETRVGRFLITDWDDDDQGEITVVGEGMLRRIADARSSTPLQPTPGGTLVSEARRIVPPGMGVAFDPTLVDRPCPAGMTWSSDRLEALYEIAAAWPALLRTDEWGQVVFRAPLPGVPAPVATLRKGERGTVTAAPQSDTRDKAFNRVVARSSKSGAEDVQAVADITTGPMDVAGPYGPVVKE